MAIRDFLFEMILFLASAVLGIVSQLLPGKRQKQLAASLAVLLLVISVAWVGIDVLLEQPEFQITPTSTAATPAPGRVFDFQVCSEPCNGSNHQDTFPQKIESIYVTWNYENIPQGAHYVRTWSLDGREWVRYDCTWNGASSGQEKVNPLAEPRGLASGVWEMVIRVDNEVLLREEITVQGRWDYWNPAGVYHSCYDR